MAVLAVSASHSAVYAVDHAKLLPFANPAFHANDLSGDRPHSRQSDAVARSLDVDGRGRATDPIASDGPPQSGAEQARPHLHAQEHQGGPDCV